MAATAGSFAVELVYLILAVAAIGLLVRTKALWWQYLIVLVAVATPVLGFYGALNPDPHSTLNLNWLALYWALGVVVVAAGLVRRDARHAPDAGRPTPPPTPHEHRGVAPLDENLDFTPAPPDTTI